MQLTAENVQRKRFIVIVPDCLAGDHELAFKIFWMAAREQCDVIYLTLVDSEENLLSANLAMITMQAMTARNCLNVQIELTKTALWKKTLRKIYQKGDRIVCQQEHRVRTGVFTTIPVSEYLCDVFNVTAITISGFYHPQKKQTVRQWLHGFIAWFGFLLILLVFLALEIQLAGQVHGMLNKVILTVLISIEIGAIWAWDTIIG